MWKRDKEVETERREWMEEEKKGGEKRNAEKAVLIANGIPHPHLQEK